MIFLAVTALVAEGQNYVIDSACVGADRLYRRDGEKGYTYDWYILDTLGTVVANPSGVDFMEVVAPGDTLWGNEIQYLWDVAGEFDIEVQVFTEHGCDTVSNGRMKVFELPEAVAGPDLVFCNFDDVTVAGDTAWNYSVFYWASGGDGYFDDPYQQHPVYHLGSMDSLNQEVTLYLTAEGLADNGTCEPAVDSVRYQFSEPDIDFSVLELLCYGDSTAAITANVIGGMPPYNFEWKGPDGFVPVNAETIKNLWAGWYVVKVTDANNCFDIDSVEIVNPPEILITLEDIQHVSCFGYNDGSIKVSASGGTGGLWFEWTNTTGHAYISNSISHLPADTYFLTVTDDNHCKATDTIVITQPDSMLAEIVTIDTLCEGDVTTLVGSRVGGTGVVQLSWSGSGLAYTSPVNDTTLVFGPAPQGIYEITYLIEDELGCQAFDTVDIYVYPPSYSHDSLEICAGDTPFSWNNHTVVSDRDSIYIDTLFGANQYGCDSILTLDVKVLFPEYITDTLYVCANDEPFVRYSQVIQPGVDSAYLDTVKYTSSGCDSLYIALQVYTLPVTEMILDSTLCAGAPEFIWNNRYILTDRDSIYLDTLVNSYGCDSLLTYDIRILPPDTFMVDTFICQDAPTFEWNSITIETFTDSTYEARLDNIYGCDSLVMLNVQLWPVTDTLLETVICQGAASFMWNNRQIVSTRDSIYLDTLVNSYGCDSLLTYDVRVILPDTTYVFDTLCQNDPVYTWNGITVQTQTDSVYEAHLQNYLTCDSTVYLSVSILQGIIIDTFVEACESYTWLEGTGATYTSSGIYDHEIGAGSCADTLRLHLLISPPMALNAAPTHLICYGDANGSINLTVSGGISPYRYVWNTGAATQDLNGLTAGTYSVTVYDSLNCSAYTEVEILEPTEIVAVIDSVTPAAFPNDPSGSIWVSTSGGIPPYTFEWQDNLGIYLDNTEDLLNQPDGTYTLYITDQNLCQIVVNATIPVKDTTTPGPYNMDCPTNPLILTCFEELEANPKVNSLSEYLALEPGISVYSDCGLIVSSFTATDSVVTNSTYCYEEYRIYSITDSCGNVLSCYQRVILDDKEAPQLTCPPAITLTNASAPPAYTLSEFIAEGGVATDNCSIVNFVLLDENSTGTFTQVIERTYRAYDYCGNYTDCVHIITINNTSNVVITCPPPVYLCPSDAVPAEYTSLSEFIAAGGDTASYLSPVDPDSWVYQGETRSGTCPEIITRTYQISNVDGDTDYCEQKIILEDNQAPHISNISDRTIYNCIGVPSAFTLNDLKKYVSENCEIAGMNYSETTVYRDGNCDYDLIRNYQVYDICGNLSNVERQVITVKDTTPPSVTKLPDLIAEDCTIPDPVSDIADFYVQGVRYADFCNPPVTMQFVGTAPGDPSAPGTFYYLYRFADACDNGVIRQQKVILDGFTIPDFDPVGPLCQYSTAPDLVNTSPNGITGKWNPAKINTSKPNTTIFVFTPDDGQCAAPYVMEVVVTPEVILSETHVDIGLSPNPIGKIDLTVQGGTAPFEFTWSNGATTEDLTNLYAGTYTVHVVDVIGCEADLAVTVTSDIPDMTCVPPATVVCPDDIEPPFTTFAEYRNAGGNATSIIGVDEASFRYIGPDDTIKTSYCLTIERTYAISDVLGNEATCVQTINVDDQVPPVISSPPGGTSECLTGTTADIKTLEEFEAAGGVVSDNCKVDRSSFTFTRTINKQNNQTEISTEYFISDLCGNTSSDIQTFILTDDVPPVAKCNSITVYLDEDGHYVLTEIDMQSISAGSSDNCTDPEDLTITVTPSEFYCEDMEETQQVTVTVADEAGNIDNCVAEIKIADNLPPTALCHDLTVYLDETGVATITAKDIDNGSFDNCTLENIQISRDRFDCTDVGENLVQLIVTDAYGLKDTCEAIVTVVDIIPPYVSCIQGDTIQLGSDGTYALTWEMVTDNTADECGIDRVELDKYLLDCDNIGITYITATAYDASGNSSTCETSFIVIGNTPPNVENDSAVTAINIPVDINVVLNDYDLKTNINLSTLGIINEPSHGSVSVDNKTGIVTYTPDKDYIGEDIFRYSICDDGIPCVPECGEAIVFITVRPANLPPVAVDDYYDLPCGVDLNGNVIVGSGDDYDPDGDGIYVDLAILTPASNGIAIMLDEYGNFEYSPNYDFKEGVDSFQYILYDKGIPELTDTAWVYVTRVADNDCDGVADVDDIDDDNDGIRDVNEGFNEQYPELSADSDQDGIPDYWDIDSDNDGIVDNIEGQGEDSYIDPIGWRDYNHNGWDDRYDDEEGGSPFDINLTDTDEDGTPDYLDTDSDNDGVYDFIEGNDEIGPNGIGDGIPDYVRFYTDLDRDGLDDAYDWIDGYGDLVDNETGSLSPLQDSDGDGVRDWRDVNDEDDEYLTHNEDINGDGDYSNDDLDLDGTPEYLDTEMECDLFIPEGFSPNDDGVHDFFQILCIYPRYPNAKLMIFNRNGQKLWEKEHYGNYDIWGWNDAWWWGNSENRFTIGRAGGLPAGNYIYVLELNDGLGGVRNGTVMIAY